MASVSQNQKVAVDVVDLVLSTDDAEMLTRLLSWDGMPEALMRMLLLSESTVESLDIRNKMHAVVKKFIDTVSSLAN